MGKKNYNLLTDNHLHQVTDEKTLNDIGAVILDILSVRNNGVQEGFLAHKIKERIGRNIPNKDIQNGINYVQGTGLVLHKNRRYTLKQ
jgi:hypothetical protein|tara:strand:- start:2782 stop:3045 length:264 start_codon:yes stop_codon:yes gene_type:complete